AATQLDYNLGDPTVFNNTGKYPVFLVNGCNAGNIYSYDTSRLTRITSLSEKFVLAKDLGSIAFIASTHFGVESYLDVYNRGFYQSLSSVNGYNLSVSINMRDAAIYLLANGFDSTTTYLHAEQNVLHGDPALKINAFAKPDFAVEDSKVIVDPTFISVADNSFNIKAYFYNLGKAEGDFVAISIKWQHPDNTITTLVDKQIVAVRYIDSVLMTVPIIASRDVGSNKLLVSIDAPGKYDELSEMNNNVTKTFFIYEDELKPVYPYNFSIVNRQNIKLIASTANPLSPVKQYTMQIDTTEFFNSSVKYSENITSVGGILEFNAGISFSDSTVYYWRVAPVPSDGNYIWNTSSFVYLPGSSFGYNQSHLYQHLKSGVDRIFIDSFSRKWNYTPDTSALKIIHSIFGEGASGTTSPADYQIQINGQTITASACLGHSVIFNVFDPITLKPYYNQSIPSTNPSGIYGGFMNSYNTTCNQPGGKTGTEYNFDFSYLDSTAGNPSGRRLMRDFMDWIPDGAIVTARLIFDEPFATQPFVDKWIKDSVYYGAGNTAYDRLKAAGFAAFDTYTYPRTWAFVYKKNTLSFVPTWKLSDGLSDQIQLQLNIMTPDTLGYITSPAFGPAAAWKQVKWRGGTLDTQKGDYATVDVVGTNASGIETVLFTLSPAQQDFDISAVSVSAYPYIKLRMRNADSIHLTPYQLRYWRLLYDPVPEGALAPNLLYNFKDSLNLGEKTNFQMAFKNVSDVSFSDSIKVNFTVYDASNVANVIAIPKLKKLNPGDTTTISYLIDSKNFNGTNNLFLDVNPDNDQPEQYHFNNFLYKKFLVNTDNFKPVMDVTFDGIHILNNDIVSAQPHVLIKIKDESKFLLLDDTSLCKVQLQYPDGSLKRFYFNNDTLRFTAATAGSADNTATIDFTPYLLDDGTYQLIVHAQDKTGNTAGGADYVVSFMVYNKPMISNMFNYPNPFTTSTSFVFTVTGNQVPQNMRIQVLTITGKIVKEITKEELGPLHIGRNITQYKWDGTDQYGQKLANGVYLYRVITNLNGNKLDKFPTYDSNGNEINTDKYFNKGYGKMYLMR
ncbi:MAG: C25 family cysteine peptidase, partial [Panacibacter sp.]